MPIRFYASRLMGVSLILLGSFSLPAGAQPSFGDCAKSVELSGYVIYDMQLEGSTYEIDARKGGQKWDIRADRSCKILDVRPD